MLHLLFMLFVLVTMLLIDVPFVSGGRILTSGIVTTSNRLPSISKRGLQVFAYTLSLMCVYILYKYPHYHL